MDFTSGYVLRSVAELPKQGSKEPWKLRQNYAIDLRSLRYGSARRRRDDVQAQGPRAGAGRRLRRALLLAFAIFLVGAAPAAAKPWIGVQGNHLVDRSGKTVRLLGVNRSGTEYACPQGWGFFDGPSDTASIRAMKSWHINAVRVPLNEACWLGINGIDAHLRRRRLPADDPRLRRRLERRRPLRDPRPRTGRRPADRRRPDPADGRRRPRARLLAQRRRRLPRRPRRPLRPLQRAA